MQGVSDDSSMKKYSVTAIGVCNSMRVSTFCHLSQRVGCANFHALVLKTKTRTFWLFNNSKIKFKKSKNQN